MNGFLPDPLQVVDIFQLDKALGPKLELVCQQHADTSTEIASLQDFDTRVSDGGCSRSCGQRLPCGHVCPR